MKKLLTGLALMLITSVSYAKAYSCTPYFDRAQSGETIKVNASRTDVAETKAASRLKKADIKVDYVRCK